jgi:hypothetical protein
VAPHVVEHVHGEFLGGFPVGSDPQGQGEDRAMRHLVEGMKRDLIARGGRGDECRPFLLEHRRLRSGVEHVAQRARRPRPIFGCHGCERRPWHRTVRNSAREGTSSSVVQPVRASLARGSQPWGRRRRIAMSRHTLPGDGPNRARDCYDPVSGIELRGRRWVPRFFP